MKLFEGVRVGDKALEELEKGERKRKSLQNPELRLMVKPA